MVTEKYKGAKYYETSSKLNQGVNELFSEIEKDLLKVAKQKPESLQL